MQATRQTKISLTHLQRIGLRAAVNLADGHVRRNPTATERPILESLQDVYKLSLGCDPVKVEKQFVQSYLALSGQRVPKGAGSFVFFSASEAIDVASRILAKHGASCSVVEPTLDNIPGLLESAGISIYPFSESSLSNLESLAQETSRSTALFAALPNNPTGMVLDEDSFRRLCTFCAKTGKALIVDACFRLYVPSAHFDYYQILNGSGIDWMVIEDTGKMWATNGLKAGVLVCSKNYISEADKLFHDLVLSISPFTLTLLWQLAEVGGTKVIEEIQDLVQHNRRVVRSSLSGSACFTADTSESTLPVERVFYDEARFPDQAKLVTSLQSCGLGVLGSEGFYWASGTHQRFLRLALSRDKDVIHQGLTVLIGLE